VPLLQRRLRFTTAIVQGVGRAEGDQLDVLLGAGNVLGRVDHDVAIFPTVLRIEDASAKRIDKVQPLTP